MQTFHSPSPVAALDQDADAVADAVAPLTGDADWPADELLDLTDRRRVLLRLLFGRDVGPATDQVFEAGSDLTGLR